MDSTLFINFDKFKFCSDRVITEYIIVYRLLYTMGTSLSTKAWKST